MQLNGEIRTALKKRETNEVRDFVFKYKKHWKWFVLSAAIGVILAFVYLRYTIPKYAATASVMLLEDKTSSSQMTAFSDLNIFSNNMRKVQDEIEVMTSRDVFIETVDKLDLNIQYYTQGRVIKVEKYNNYPITLNFIASDSIINNSKLTAYIEVLSVNDFNYWEEKEGNQLPKKKYSFGNKINSSLGDLLITPSLDKINSYIGATIEVNITPVTTVAQNLKRNINVLPIDVESNVIQILYNDVIKEKAIDVINTLIETYNDNSLEEKSLVSKQTTEFLNKRIDLIAADLADVDNVAERFKTGNKLTNIAADADIYLSSSSANEQEMVVTGTELSMVNYMKESVSQRGTYETMPANIGLSDPGINNITTKYNELVIERQRLLKSSNEKNPVVVNLDQQLDGLKESMSQSLNNLGNTLNIKYQSLSDQAARINSKIYSVPGQERELRDIQRQQQIKESLYLYLLEKREETEIATASVSPNIKVIDNAYIVSDTPVSPKKKIVYLAAIVLGMLVPFSVIRIKHLLDNKIHNKEDLLKLFRDVPIIGEIPKIEDKNEKTIKTNDRSVLAESFRLLRTNLDYVMRKQKDKKLNNIIFVTSTINGEGKSFVSYNLGLTLAYSNKKTLLIGGDIRNPGLNLFLNGIPANIGLTEYLQKPDLKVADIINPVYNDIPLDIILSGKIPPNPAELLMSNRLEELFDIVSDNYDYVIVDTAPAMLVTDTLLISKYAGNTVYITRAEYTDKRMLDYPRELFDDNKLNGMMMVINDVDTSNFSYGGRYGYGYYGTNRKAKRVKRRRFDKVKI
ncbi:polysaccharide biosynthesis tyrosine autokinase [Zhouia spongiae]|uniref:Polysaccharide biosynthesis tyrosine autokinase n=1 Tax=Zhouia spongiae TaxID=2202721 RepID=A0ABY3YKM9_9FLAO|nr:polysaccharide biosynthesis tyrosine autokinase [Zhouia spongiae]UNY98382.1 polysaccharide biosynthesis tyrosine autokinase [Zhouia spongiae]